MPVVQKKEFDYIIAGGGMAGLSLAFQLNRSTMAGKRVLVIDKAEKASYDHTWCFWEREPSTFEEIVFHRWKKLWFHGTNDFSKSLDIDPFEYKMIRSDDFYRYVRKELSGNRDFSFLTAEIKSVEDSTVSTTAGNFSALELVFDSFTRQPFNSKKHHNLLQHFLGWTVRSERPAFEPDAATLFDFRVSQKGDCRFFYILPFSDREALVEFTVFSPAVLENSDYEIELSCFLKERCGVYEVVETEKGVIPMSDEPISELVSPRVIRIGTSGGYVKPSTGYSFKRTQRRLAQIVRNLEDRRFSGNPLFDLPRRSRWKSFMDSVFLEILETRGHPADDVFTKLFQRNSPGKLLRFLDEDTSFTEDLAIMSTVPRLAFSKAGLFEAAKTLRLS